MKLRPLNDRVLVKRIESETKTAGGLFIPETAKEKPQEGLVVAVGEGRHFENGKVRPLEVKAGDKVFFRKYAGNEINVDGVEHIILREEEVLAVFN
jgi:chaperonin GroES